MIKYRKFAHLLLVASATLGCTAASERWASLHDQAFASRTVPPEGAGLVEDPVAAGDPWKGTTELSLDAVLAVAEERNPTLAAARASWQAAVERYPQVTSLQDPTLGYTLAPRTIGAEESSYAQRIDVVQKLPWPGKLALRGEAALDDAEAEGDHAEDARQHLQHAVTEAFWALWLAQRTIEINQTNQTLLSEFHRIAGNRYAAGIASKSDALRAEVEHQHLVHRGIALERERAVAQARLNTLLNLPPKHPLPRPARSAVGPRELPPLPSLEAAALDERPQLLALSHRVEARSADVELAHREYFPDFAVNAAYDSLWEDPDKQTLVGFAIDVPLQLGRRRAEVSAAEASARRARAELEQARAETLLEVSEAYDQLVETGHVVHLYESSILPLARESLEAARSGYEAGTNDFQTLVETEKTLYLSELTYQEALADYHRGRSRLEYAVGRPLDALDREEVRP